MLHRGRGGWCFEQNLLLSHMLEAIGFDVVRLAARVRINVPPERITPRSHMLLRVRLPEGDYIADVGFGGLTLSSPLKLVAGIEQPTHLEPNRLVEVDGGYRLEALVGEEWRALYVFDLARQQLADYEVSNWYLCNHPDSIFLKMAVAAKCEPARRLTLRGVRYSEHYPDGRLERGDVTSVAQWRELVQERFGIRVPDAPNLEARLEKMIEENAGA
jgi:N-hydroxyarylamine O-acetyltransferase